ncbi:RNA polymerase sigma factor [Methylomonas sp. CM2]|uniref:RNA polymerase sigma factor n=1 Tax=Methylomonas sp. CM2 TaxID=3417647 RepID=UPI003CF6E1D9
MALSIDDISGIYFCARPQLQQFLVRRVHCPDTAAELLQEVYLRLPHLKPPPQTEGEVRAWLYRVAGNLSIDHIRAESRHAELLERFCGDAGEEDVTAAPDHVAMFCEEIQRVQALLAQLPPRCAQILRLNRLEGLTYAEVGAHLGISRSLVEKEMVKILDHLRAGLDDEDEA